MRIRVVREGGRAGGAPVLLLHGFTGSVEAWGREVVNGLAGVAPVLAVDLPGHGGSDAPSSPERYAVERVLSDLLHVLDREGVRAADWVGYSLGGRIALAAAVLHPDRVRRLVLEGASPGLPTEAERAERRARDEALARRLEEEGIERFVDSWMEQPLFASQRRLPPEVLAAARERRLLHRPEALAAVLRGTGSGSQPSFWERLGEVESSVLLLTGELDSKFRSIAERMAERLPRAVHGVVPDAGHTVHLEAPGAWLKRVVPFLRGP